MTPQKLLAELRDLHKFGKRLPLRTVNMWCCDVMEQAEQLEQEYQPRPEEDLAEYIERVERTIEDGQIISKATD